MCPADIKLNTSRASTPKSEQSVLLLDRFYDDCGKCGRLRANIFHQPEVVAFLSDKEKEASNADREIVDDSSPMDITDHSASSIGSSYSTYDEKYAFVAMCFQAPSSHQRAFVVQYVKQHTSVNAVYWNAPPFPQGPAPLLVENPPKSETTTNYFDCHPIPLFENFHSRFATLTLTSTV